MQFAIKHCGVTLQVLNLIRKIIHAENILGLPPS